MEATLDESAQLIKANRENYLGKLKQLISKQREQDKLIEQLRQQLSSKASGNLTDQAEDIGGVKLLATRVDGGDAKSLRELVDRLKNQLAPAAIVLASVDGEKVSLVAGVTKDLVARVPANEMINIVAGQVGGKGGGRPDMAQAGGNQPQNLETALASVSDWLLEKVNN